uniref:Death domain-containing protein n=1 Tax=Branchiostoma floridae TaxID=7739 RepID=C3Y7F6_BRAFL|eukprot:XP_002607774.1 hypothetical protein BRAFLDRAFT_64173 [Branchiostoma floridae]
MAAGSGEHSRHHVDVQKCFDDVVAEVSNNWDNLARKLRFSENEIKGLRTDEPDQDRRCREMLHRWRNREGAEATLQVLQQALVDIKERLTAERLEGPGTTHSRQYFPLVAKGVASCWVKFAKEQLTLTKQDIHGILLRSSYDREHQALQALELWREKSGRKACRVKLAEALRKGGFQQTAVELDRYGGQEVKINEFIAEKPAYVTDGISKKDPHDLPQSDSLPDDESTIYHTLIETGERIFDKKTVQDYDEFDKCVKSFEPIAATVPDDEVRKILKPKLQSGVKLRIKVRVTEKIAEVAQIVFRDKVLDPENKELYYKMADCFARFQAALRKAEQGCVFCHLDFPDAGCYDTFWQGYCDGSLSDTLTRELITEDIRAAEGGADLYIDVRVSYSATGEDDFQDQDPSGSTGQGPQHPGPSREHPGQGPTAPSISHGDDDTPLGYHGDDTGDTGRQVSGAEGTIQVKEEPDEQGTGASFMTGTIKSEVDTQLYAIADHLGSMWERLATTLGFKTDYIRDLTDRLPPYLRPRRLIRDWIQRNYGDVTLDQLVQALRNAGIHEVADAVESGQLFAVAATFETAKEKRSEDMDTDRPGGEERSNERLPDDTDSESSAPGGFHQGSQSTTSMYPTGEDALAWNDCLQDFFKTDENTTRTIQESWPTAWLNHTIAMKEIKLHYNKFSAEGVRDFVEIIKGRAHRLLSDELLYDGTQGVESVGENVWWGEQQLEKLRRERGLIVVKVGQLTVRISHEGTRS